MITGIDGIVIGEEEDECPTCGKQMQLASIILVDDIEGTIELTMSPTLLDQFRKAIGRAQNRAKIKAEYNRQSAKPG